MTIVAFDIETATPASDDNNAPLGVTCAATFAVDEERHPPYDCTVGNLRLWHSDYAPRMNQNDLTKMIEYLLAQSAHGVDVVAWNSVGFDFRVSALEFDQADKIQQKIRHLALRSIDPAFSMFCARGYMIGLNTAASGLGVTGKLDGMNGLEAISAWQENREQQDLVLEYVGQDAIATANVWAKALQAKSLPWTSQSGRRQRFRFYEVNGMTVAESLLTQEPNTSWMSNPRSRSEITAWLEAAS